MRGSVVLVLLGVLTLGFGIGRSAISDSDEAYYAEAAREMLDSGDYLTPHYNFVPRFQKPVLFYWIILLFYRLIGVGELAARAGSALAALGSGLVVYHLGRRWFGQNTGVRAGAIVITAFAAAGMARTSLPDMPLAFFVTAAIAAGLVPLVERVAHPRRWWLLASAMAALAVLTKGPIGLAVPAVVLGPAFLSAQRQRRPSLTTLALSALLFTAVAAPWYAAMTAAHGLEYARGFFLGDNLERFATTRFNEQRSLFYYLPIVVAGLMPWSPLGMAALPSLRTALARRARPAVRSVAVTAWILAPLVLFSVSVGKQPRYILPILPALALALARALDPILASDRPPSPGAALLLRAGAAISALVFVLFGIVLVRASPLLSAVGVTSTPIAAAITLAAGMAVAVTAASRRWQRIVPSLALTSASVILVVQYGVLAVPGKDAVQRMADHVAAHRRPGERLASHQAFVRNLVFYTHVQQHDLPDREALLAYLDAPDRVLCVMRAGTVAELAREGRQVKRLADVVLFDPSIARPRTLLAPDPGRDVQTIVLVANR